MNNNQPNNSEQNKKRQPAARSSEKAYDQKQVLEQIESADEYHNFRISYEPKYLKNPHIQVRFTSTYKEYLCITELESAQVRGKTCVSFTLESENLRSILEKFDYSFSELIKALKEAKEALENQYGGGDFHGCRVYLSEEKSVRFYSPLAHDRFKPLKSEPKKWTIAHVIRGLINNQIINTRCESRYTDDYAYDAATNYGAGKVDPIELAKDLIESPSGWWVNRKAENYIGINCHSFKYMAGDLAL